MNSLFRSVVVLVVPLPLLAAEAPPMAMPPPELGTAIHALTGAVERLAATLERDASSRADEQEDRRVEVAIGILEMRYRKIDRLEAEIQAIGREEEEFERQIGFMKAEVEQLDRQGRAESGQLTVEARGAIDQMELRIRLEEERIARSRERALVLQNDVTAEQRRLAGVEAIIDEWMEKQ